MQRLTDEERREHKKFFVKRYKDAHYKQLNLHMKKEYYDKIVAAAHEKNMPVRRYCMQKLLKELQTNRKQFNWSQKTLATKRPSWTRQIFVLGVFNGSTINYISIKPKHEWR